VEALEPSPTKARVTGTAARLMMLSSRDEEAIHLGEEALALAERLGIDEIKAAALVDIGSARAAAGEDEGLAILGRAVGVAREANAAFDLCRAIGNLAAWHWVRGELAEAAALWRDALTEAERYGQKGFARWFRAVPLHTEYEFGAWDDAVERADAFIAEVEAGLPHYLASPCYADRAHIRLARGDEAGALADADQALALAVRIKDPQALFPAVATVAHVAAELGNSPGPSTEEFLDAVRSGSGVGFSIASVHVLAWTLVEAGRGLEVAEGLEQFGENPWARAGAAYGRGDSSGAADVLGRIGALASEAFCRLAAARALVEQGRRAEADEQLQRALAFYRSVGAKRYVREGEALLAVSA
jgi:tetratricopeptide (TPR) repeat protein